MTTARKKLGAREELAVAALLVCDTQEKAAESAGVSVSTLRRWLADPAFLARYSAARREVMESAIREVTKLTGEAVATLRRNLTSGKAGVEVRAAAVVLDAAFRAADRDLEQRIAALEKKMEGDRGNEV